MGPLPTTLRFDTKNVQQLIYNVVDIARLVYSFILNYNASKLKAPEMQIGIRRSTLQVDARAELILANFKHNLNADEEHYTAGNHIC